MRAFKLEHDNFESAMEVSNLLKDSPELFRVYILGLDITIACLENLCNMDFLNPEWEIMFKVNKYDPKLNNMGILYNTSEGKDKFSYKLILDRLEKVIKNKIEIEN